MAFGNINTVSANMRGIEVQECGSMVTGNVAVIGMAGYAQVGSGLVATGQVAVIWSFIDDHQIEITTDIMAKLKPRFK